MKRLLLLLTLLLTGALNAAPVSLEWTDNSTNESAFEIERSLDGQTWESRHVMPIPDGSTTGPVQWTDDTEEVCYYRVRAANEYGYSGYTNTVRFELPTIAAPSGLTQPPTPVLRFTTVDGKTAIVEIVQPIQPVSKP